MIRDTFQELGLTKEGLDSFIPYLFHVIEVFKQRLKNHWSGCCRRIKALDGFLPYVAFKDFF